MSTEERQTVKLRRPIKLGDEVIEALEFRRGRFSDLKGLRISVGSGGEIPIDFDTIMTLAARMSGQPTAIIDKLDEEDASVVAELVGNFFVRFLTTGGTPSQ